MKITVVDLFCGIGGLTHGLQLAGLNVVAGYDIDLSCRYAYEDNNNAIFVHGDVAEISADKINKHYEDSDIRVLVGCAPCQPFSKYTLRYRKSEAEEASQRGSYVKKHNKWGLVSAFAEKIRQVRPHVVSMENVPELRNTDVFKQFIKTLENMDYKVSFVVAYCPDYGVPQNRKRLVLLASNLGEINLIAPLYTPEEYITVRRAIGALPEINAGERHNEDSLHFSARLNETNLLRIQSSVEGGTWRDWDEALQLACHKKPTGRSYPSVYGRMRWDEPSPTITTQFYGYGNGRFGHPEQDRAISIREGAILQSFPQGYRIGGVNNTCNTRTMGTHIGNAVPVELGRAIGTSIINHLLEVVDYE